MESRPTLESLVKGFRDGAKVVVMGVGNPDHPYDALGDRLGRDLERRMKRRKAPRLSLAFVHAQTIPENFIGVARRHAPDHVVILDAADFGGAFGEPRVLIDAELDGATVSCHKLPFALFSRVLTDGAATTVHVVGFQTRPDFDPADPGYKACLDRVVAAFAG